MKTPIRCEECGHEVEIQEDERIQLDTGLQHRADGGHQYTVGVRVGLGFGGEDARR